MLLVDVFWFRAAAADGRTQSDAGKPHADGARSFLSSTVSRWSLSLIGDLDTDRLHHLVVRERGTDVAVTMVVKMTARSKLDAGGPKAKRKRFFCPAVPRWLFSLIGHLDTCRSVENGHRRSVGGKNDGRTALAVFVHRVGWRYLRRLFPLSFLIDKLETFASREPDRCASAS